MSPPAPSAAIAELELMANRLSAIAREMGEALRRVALSTNVKERLDFSCALLDPGGNLVVNAPHVPVHLGALGLCVREVTRVLALGAGDSAVTNHPAFGGSHLPDVTVITPVDTAHGVRLGYVASRAHHAEIGGIRPGSMPPDARWLAQEGVVIAPRLLVAAGASRFAELEALLRAGPHPSRSPEENLADLRAALAANQRGADGLLALAARDGEDHLRHHLAALRARSATRARAALERLGGVGGAAEELLDDGTRIRVAITVRGGSARVDFTGTSERHPGNLNAPPAVTRAAILYFIRVLVAEPLPLNEGLLDCVDIVLPECFLNPRFAADDAASPAVALGNVETSQRVVDTLFKALGLAACSQGTMNNLLFGDQHFGYYETICGGTGAGPGFAGASAVHSHLTNTRITDPEVLELRYPVRLERFSVRRGSGGAGRHRGGDGAVRALRFLAPVEVSLLAQHRVVAPYGLAGGGDGAVGRQWLEPAGGGRIELAGQVSLRAEPGDLLVVETPGGGGYGAADDPGAR